MAAACIQRDFYWLFLLIPGLSKHGLTPKDIHYVVGTHGHSDHIGNLNLFPDATFIVSYDICKGDTYIDHTFDPVSIVACQKDGHLQESIPAHPAGLIRSTHVKLLEVTLHKGWTTTYRAPTQNLCLLLRDLTKKMDSLSFTPTALMSSTPVAVSANYIL